MSENVPASTEELVSGIRTYDVSGTGWMEEGGKEVLRCRRG
jgi:hypothetical protein